MNKGIQISRQIQKRVLEYVHCPEIDSLPSFPPILDKGLKIDLAPTSQGVKGSQTTYTYMFYSVGFLPFLFPRHNPIGLQRKRLQPDPLGTDCF